MIKGMKICRHVFQSGKNIFPLTTEELLQIIESEL